MSRLSLLAKAYIALVVLTGGCLVAFLPGELTLPKGIADWILLGVTTACAAACQIWKVEGTTAKTSYNLGLAIFGFTLLVLGPTAAIMVAVVASVVEWIWHRYAWYIQTFNIFCLVVALATSGLVYRELVAGAAPISAWGVAGVIAAAICFVLLNHLMVGLVILFARKERFGQSGVFARMGLLIDGCIFAIGCVGAMLWLVSPWASLLMLIPLYMFSVTLKVPSLERQATTDSKTGLFNARYFQQALDREISRANRFDRPLTVVIGDLDLLRNINNTYGHLAGDQVLVGIAHILKDRFRDYDVVARIGGEEFSILMPETTAGEAVHRVERLREMIEAARFKIETSVEPIRATMSFGLAERCEPEQKAKTLLHRADLALYRAKLEGRNLVRLAPGRDEDLREQDRPAAPTDQMAPVASISPMTPMAANDRPAPTGLPGSVASAVYPSQTAPTADDSSTTKVRHPEASGHRGNGNGRHGARDADVPRWRVPAFVATVVLVALACLGVTLYLRGFSLAGPWHDLGLFAVVAVLAESLAVDIYVRDTSVSTSGAPFIAGAMLFGPLGALVIAVLMAGAAMLKHHSPADRFAFNSSVHLIAGLAASWVMILAARWGISSSAWVELLLAVACSLILFCVTTWLVAAVIATGNASSVIKTWIEKFGWVAPYYFGLGLVAAGFLICYQRVGHAGTLIVVGPLFVLHYAQGQYIKHTKNMVASLRASKLLAEQHADKISQLNEDLLMLVSNITDLQDPYMNKHCQHVSRYATLIARELGLDEVAVDEIRKAGLLHDVGKLGTRYDLLWKPGRLTDAEYEEVKGHARLGKEILDPCTSLTSIANIVCHHHENYDGSGYPYGLRGDEIPIQSRILRVADTVEAIASDRAYRAGSSVNAILAELEAGTGREFDVSVVAALRHAIHRDGEALVLNSAEEVGPRHAEPAQANPAAASSHALQPEVRTA